MIKIGELSTISGVPVKTIRFYEEEGLINPVEVDRWTNYRYFDESSLVRLSEIAYLKDLGFSLKEIKSFDKNTIKSKINEMKEKIEKLTENIHELNSICRKGEIIMKNFINDARVIGKWHKLGVVSDEKDALTKKFDNEKKDLFVFNELYFLPNGERYWTLAWTKGKLFVNDRALDYKITDGMLLVYLRGFYGEDTGDIVVYEQVDKMEYTPHDIQIRDNTDLPFVKDSRVIGKWEAIACIEKKEIEAFKKTGVIDDNHSSLNYVILNADGTAIREWKSESIDRLKWTKGVLIDEEMGTASEYEIFSRGGVDYLSIEWKSGDYIYGGFIFVYYLFKRM